MVPLIIYIYMGTGIYYKPIPIYPYAPARPWEAPLRTPIFDIPIRPQKVVPGPPYPPPPFFPRDSRGLGPFWDLKKWVFRPPKRTPQFGVFTSPSDRAFSEAGAPPSPLSTYWWGFLY